ncbi:cobalt/magnesium transport protein CorA [Lachnospiraceae bacterium]|nr:hypothetical protein [Eubacterium sp.]GFI28550.1 cobalt/magnesium transport protein CorA [Lachnospiraceae bacterium]
MYYRICEQGLVETDRRCWEEQTGAIGIFDEEEWSRELNLQEEFSLDRKEEHTFFCRFKIYASYLFGVFYIPVKKKERKHDRFAVYILKDRLIFIEEDSFVKDLIHTIRGRIRQEDYTMELFLDDFFMAMVEEDILYLAVLEREIADMEERVLQGETDYFHYRMLGIKKEISRLYCYYCQLMDAAKILSGKMNTCGDFSERIDRLKQEAQSLREYAMQVQDVYQSEISIHQNNIMKLLTVVTTIFLPLTLIAGWYGMNFYNMPELGWKYGYPVVSGLSVLIIIGSLWYFKKKKFL